MLWMFHFGILYCSDVHGEQEIQGDGFNRQEGTSRWYDNMRCKMVDVLFLTNYSSRSIVESAKAPVWTTSSLL
jgi:hypothetical protein